MPLELVAPEEQLVRKKAEEKLPKVPKEPREHKGHIPVPKLIISERERRAGVPIIPGDACCANICETLNEKIDRNRYVLDTTVAIGGDKSLYKSPYRSLMYQIETLEDHRQDLKDKGSCRCIEETGAVSIIIPLIQAQKTKKVIPITGIKLITPSPKKLREPHLREKSIIPSTNACCPESCKILNNEIDITTKILDNMELRGGPEATKNLRYEALSAKAFALQDYRVELKNKGSCKCVE